MGETLNVERRLPDPEGFVRWLRGIPGVATATIVSQQSFGGDHQGAMVAPEKNSGRVTYDYGRSRHVILLRTTEKAKIGHVRDKITRALNAGEHFVRDSRDESTPVATALPVLAPSGNGQSALPDGAVRVEPVRLKSFQGESLTFLKSTATRGDGGRLRVYNATGALSTRFGRTNGMSDYSSLVAKGLLIPDPDTDRHGRKWCTIRENIPFVVRPNSQRRAVGKVPNEAVGTSFQEPPMPVELPTPVPALATVAPAVRPTLEEELLFLERTLTAFTKYGAEWQTFLERLLEARLYFTAPGDENAWLEPFSDLLTVIDRLRERQPLGYDVGLSKEGKWVLSPR